MTSSTFSGVSTSSMALHIRGGLRASSLIFLNCSRRRSAISRVEQYDSMRPIGVVHLTMNIAFRVPKSPKRIPFGNGDSFCSLMTASRICFFERLDRMPFANVIPACRHSSKARRCAIASSKIRVVYRKRLPVWKQRVRTSYLPVRES